MDQEWQAFIEPAGASLLIATPRHQVFAIALCQWLIERLRAELGAKLDGVELNLVPVCHLGCYPAIGLKFREYHRGEELENLVDAAIREILGRHPVIDFIDYVQRSDVDWNKEAVALISHPPKAWQKLPVDSGQGWKAVDPNGVERARYMDPNKNGLYFHEKLGYMRQKNENGEFLDVSRNIVLRNHPLFPALTHIFRSDVKQLT